MEKTIRHIAITTLALFIMAGAGLKAAPARLIAVYIGPVTLNNGNGPFRVGTPDSIAYTYSGSRAVYNLRPQPRLRALLSAERALRK